MARIYFLCAVIAAAIYTISARAGGREEREFRFPTQGTAAARYLSRWIGRVSLEVEDAYNDGVLSAERYDALHANIAGIRILARAALADGVVTAEERQEIRHAIGQIKMEVAEARFGPAKPKPERWASREPLHPRLHPKPPPIESGTGTVEGGSGTAR